MEGRMSENPVVQAAQQYVAESARYLSMREIGEQLGVTSHVVGRKLKEAGLRTQEGNPSAEAIEGGYTKAVQMYETFPLYVWHQEKTLRVLRPLITAKGGNEIMPGVFIG
jgi:hypothetical protein